MSDLKQLLLALWSGPIQKKYIKGEICSERHLQCELYHLLSMDRSLTVWVEPTIVINHGTLKRTIKPDLLVSTAAEIIAIIEIKNVPDGEARYKEDVGKMVMFGNASEALYALHMDISTGRFQKEKEMRLSANLLSVYAAISKGGFAHAVNPVSFWKEQNREFETPHNFLHLVGRLYKDGTTQFCESSVSPPAIRNN